MSSRWSADPDSWFVHVGCDHISRSFRAKKSVDTAIFRRRRMACRMLSSLYEPSAKYAARSDHAIRSSQPRRTPFGSARSRTETIARKTRKTRPRGASLPAGSRGDRRRLGRNRAVANGREGSVCPKSTGGSASLGRTSSLAATPGRTASWAGRSDPLERARRSDPHAPCEDQIRSS